MSAWQPIETANPRVVALVCNERHGRPYTIAKASFWRGSWRYSGSDEPIHFNPLYWIAKDVSENPFHLPLPDPPHTPATSPSSTKGEG